MEKENTPEQIPEVNPELAARLIGNRAVEMYAVPTDPMDDLQCDSCQ